MSLSFYNNPQTISTLLMDSFHTYQLVAFDLITVTINADNENGGCISDHDCFHDKFPQLSLVRSKVIDQSPFSFFNVMGVCSVISDSSRNSHTPPSVRK